ncbi:Maf family protein [Asticcacaulis sp. DW145]|uniref:Maf family protein n=1 Tax=Asticcacaulis sp. DW145 TaxID=3095608 RepID=UPI0030875105|nr:Maf family protein [Asticcacaulis sp. DW145]
MTPSAPPPLILASGSKIRATLLTNCGLSFSKSPADLDEDVIKDDCLLRGFTPKAVALRLAQEKALHVSRGKTGLVIGADSVLQLDNDLISKQKTLADAANLLRRFSGKTHYLHSAVAVAQDGQLLWSHADTADLSVRRLSEEFIAQYIETAGEEILSSVGCYMLEAHGVHLFDSIKGDYFTVLGLPLLPLLAQLRHYEIIAA